MFASILLRFLVFQLVVIEALRNYCFYDNLQRQYCLNKVVLKATVIDVGDENEYTIKILHVYKGNVEELNKKGNDSVIVKVNTKYAISGKQYVIFGNAKNGTLYSRSCNGIFPMLFLLPVQEDSLVKYYKSGCNCLDEIGNYSHEVFCKWRFGYMEKSNGKCIWSGGASYKKCESDNSISTTSEKPNILTSTEETNTQTSPTA